MGNEQSLPSLCCSSARSSLLSKEGSLFDFPDSSSLSSNSSCSRLTSLQEADLHLESDSTVFAAELDSSSPKLCRWVRKTFDLKQRESCLCREHSEDKRHSQPVPEPYGKNHEYVYEGRRGCTGTGAGVSDEHSCLIFTAHHVGESQSVIAVWHAERVRRMSRGDEGSLFSRRKERMTFLSCTERREEIVYSMRKFRALDMDILAVSSSKEDESNSGVRFFFVRQGPPDGVAIELVPIEPVKSDIGPLRKLDFSEPDLLVGHNEAGDVVGWTLGLKETDNALPCQSLADCLQVTKRFHLTTGGFLAGLFVRNAPLHESHDHQIFEPQREKRKERAVEHDLLAVSGNGLIRIYRLSVNNETPEVLLSFNANEHLGHEHLTFTCASISSVSVQHQPFLPGGSSGLSHSFSLLFLNGVDQSMSSLLCMWDLRKTKSPFVRRIANPKGCNIASIAFGPYLNGPLVYATNDGLIRVVDVNGQEHLKSTKLMGAMVRCLLVDFNQAVWCISTDSHFFSI